MMKTLLRRRRQISADFPTISETLKTNGYTTYMSSKWHLTVEGAFEKPNGSYPTQRGFDKYYGCLSGGGSYYTPTPVYSGIKRMTEFPDNYYYTTAITDSTVSFINNHPTNVPMFMYLAHYAPHRPLQAPKDRVEACRERYKVGYDVLRQQHFNRQKENVLKGKFCREFSHIIDVMPTCLEMASAGYPKQFNNKELHTTEGESLLPAIQNKKLASRDLFFEHNTSCAILSDGWKLVRDNAKHPWELIDLTADPFEENDQAAMYPEKVKALEKKWNRWAEEKHVFPFEYRPWGERVKYYKTLYPDQSGVN